MSSAARIAVIALVAGVMLAGIVVFMRRGPGEPAMTLRRADPAQADAKTLSRCRTITMPETACEQAWDAERRRFFRDDR